MRTQSKFRLLIVRLGAMGDILHALPAVTALRQAHPRWTIDWVIEPTWLPLLSADQSSESRSEAQPLVDHIHLAPSKVWRRRPLHIATVREIRSLRHQLRFRGYDAVLDLQGAIRSAVIARMAGCRRRIGESHPRERAARWLFTERIATQGAHVIEQDLELASAVCGDDLQPITPLLPIDSAAESWCDQLLAPTPNTPIVLMNPGAGWGAKRWPVDRYAAVAASLARQGCRVLINAGPGEAALARSLRDQSAGAAEPLNCSLSQLIALTRRIALCIAGDTGPLHLASALGRPVVGIYGPTDPRRNGPYSSEFRVLRSPESRRDHTRRNEAEAGLLTITPEDVLTAARDLLHKLSKETVA